MLNSVVITVSIARPYAEVYDFCVDPMNFGRWNSMPGSAMEAVGGNDYLVDLPQGRRIMLPPGVESWNDTGNNEAFLAGSIAYTHNAFSVYAKAKKENNPVFPNIALLRAPTANNGDSRDGGNVGGWLTIFKNAPNKDLAKKLALELIDPKTFNPMAALASGLFMISIRSRMTGW